MSQSVFLLLSMLLLQASGCDRFMINFLQMKDEHRFREVFPKDYKITHHYNNSLLDGSGPGRLLCEAFMLSHSWSQLLLQLWEENRKYPLIVQLKEHLEAITDQKFQEPPNLLVFPSVSSTPEALLDFTSTFFVAWLQEKCKASDGNCEFPLPNFKEEDIKSTPTSFTTRKGRVEEGIRQQWSGAPQTNLATSTNLSISYFLWCFPLLWTVL